MNMRPSMGENNLPLYNQFDRPTLEKHIKSSGEERRVLSFYRYVHIDMPQDLRDKLYLDWRDLGVLGRVYVATEGVNAQISVASDNLDAFLDSLESYFPHMPIKFSLDDTPDAFIKLIVRLKKKLVADGLEDSSFDTSNVGKHLSAREFNEALDQPDTIVVDVRNHYESEVGHFDGAICPDVCSFREELPVIRDMLEDKKDKKILLYCTGGIRCEKTSAWLKHHGFQDVNQLHGGIINYVQQVKSEGLENKFIGKNFVFDERLGERVTEDVIANCHVCGEKSDDHTNCKWQACHILLIMCNSCRERLDGCCSEDCMEKTRLSADEQKRLRKIDSGKVPGFFKGKRKPEKVYSNSTI